MAYNGWKNYETWNVALWWDNDEGSQEWTREVAREAIDEAKGCDQVAKGYWPADRAPVYILADVLKDAAEEQMFEQLTHSSGFTCDLASGALSEVDWYEIAEHYIDDAAENEAYEAAS